MTWPDYEAAKRSWVEANLGATAQEYTDAIKTILKRLEL